jgi:uncharacterized phage infection (PIP) family protein YhgE
MDSETVKLILEFIEKYGFPAAVAVAMFVLLWRQQGLAKSESAQQDKMLEQNANTLSLYTSTKETIKSLDSTLAKWFKTAHDDSTQNDDTIQALTAQIGTLEIAMTNHAESTPTISDLMQSIEDLGRKIDNVDRSVNEIKAEFNTVKTQAETVKKTTQEVPVLDAQESKDKSISKTSTQPIDKDTLSRGKEL